MVLKEKLPEQRKDRIIANLKKNWLFIVSGAAFLLYTPPDMPWGLITWGIGVLIALLLYVLIASQLTSIDDWLRKDSKMWLIFYFLTTAGVCWSSQIYFYQIWSKSSILQMVDAMLPEYINLVQCISGVISIATFYFLYVWMAVFWRLLRKNIELTNLFFGIKKLEFTVYILVFAVLCSLAIFTFHQSEAFYGTDINYDIIYTSDSTEQVREGVYTSFWHSHNEIKQPMFTLFASPFSGALFFFGKIFGLSDAWRALLVDFSQIALLMCSVFILTKMLRLTVVKRVCFVLLFFSGYTGILSVVMMEQFVVSLFWLLLLLYNISEEKKPDPFLLVASGGAVVTNLVCTPLLSDHVFTRNYKEWFKDMCRYACYFIVAYIGVGRIKTLTNFVSGVGKQLSTFGGAKVSLYERFCQYTVFIKNYFLMPEAGVGNQAQFGCTWPSWQLIPADGVNIFGAIIFLLAMVSVWLNRDKKSSLLSGAWIVFSVGALCILGWGSAENGMILYSLYFGWPFLVLLFQLIEKLEEKLRLQFVIPIVCILCITFSLICNIPALYEMIEFAATTYPG